MPQVLISRTDVEGWSPSRLILVALSLGNISRASTQAIDYILSQLAVVDNYAGAVATLIV